ncbi:MAG: P-loop NTPase fold protein [Alphaproteobacteria bacterium]
MYQMPNLPIWLFFIVFLVLNNILLFFVLPKNIQLKVLLTTIFSSLTMGFFYSWDHYFIKYPEVFIAYIGLLGIIFISFVLWHNPPEKDEVLSDNLNRYIDKLNSYLIRQDSGNMRGAFLVRGEWGAGKSYFINEIFFRKYTKKKEKWNFSVFGKNDLNDLESEIIVFPYLLLISIVAFIFVLWGLHGVWNFWNTGEENKLIENRLLLIRSITPLFITTLIPFFVLLRKAWVFHPLRKIAVIDDVERRGTNLDLKEVLGLVDKLAREKKWKIIFICNESELSRRDKKTFEQYKDKIFIEEICFQLSPSERWELLHKNIISTYIKNELRVVFEESKFENIRNYQLAIKDWNSFFKALSSEIKNHENIKNLMKIYFILYLEIVHDKILTKEILKLGGNSSITSSIILYDSNKMDQDKWKEAWQVIVDKYSSISLSSVTLPFVIWYKVFFEKQFNIQEINQILSYLWFDVNKQPSWLKIWEIPDLTDKEYLQYKEEIDNDFETLKYNRAADMFHIFGLLLYFCEDTIARKKLVDKAKEYIDTLERENRLITSVDDKSYNNFLENRGSASENGSMQYGFYDNDTDEFIEIKEYYISKVTKHAQGKFPSLVNNLFNKENYIDKDIINNKFDILLKKEFRNLDINGSIVVNQWANDISQMENTEQIDSIFSVLRRFEANYTENYRMITENLVRELNKIKEQSNLLPPKKRRIEMLVARIENQILKK